MIMATRPVAAARHSSQGLTLLIGAVYTLVGLLGFVVTGVGDFAAGTDKVLLGFELNPLHNLVHLLIGLAGLTMWRRLDTAYGWLLLAGYGVGAHVRAVRCRQPRHQLSVVERRRQRAAHGQRAGRRGDQLLAGRSGHRGGIGACRASLTAAYQH
jgi:hypothetical protein